jgi:hypothetical protein
MFTLRCTQKLLRRGPWEPAAEDHSPTTLLGDWYANLLFCKPQHLVLCISERTLLPVIVPAKDPQALPERLANGVQLTLAALGIASTAVEDEITEMRALHIGRTMNKRILGSLNDFMFHLKYELQAHPSYSLLERSLSLAEIPCKPLEYESADRATRALFMSASALHRARGRGAL